MTKLLIACALAGCSGHPVSWHEADLGDPALSSLACEAWSAAAEFWSRQRSSPVPAPVAGAAVTRHETRATCTAGSVVEVWTGERTFEGWLTWTAEEGMARLGHEADFPLDDVDGCASVPRGDAFIQLHGLDPLDPGTSCRLAWLAAHELGHQLGYDHDDAWRWELMGARSPLEGGCEYFEPLR
jgi:hypothetical protein